ncbi:MAG: nicotinate (nicotinamide) nucleotide adenylyltransferase [Eubacteriaceae bacterium]|nr:nicotinate (nicotinamide) nucleotide adenylyltransferase [Eubacteriaceae bacterium]
MTTPSRIGVLGGSFDPPHIGHGSLASLAITAANLEKVVMVPSGDHPFKLHLGQTKRQRFEMCELFASLRTGIEVSAIEVEKQGVCYTCDTLLELQQIYGPRLCFVAGSDLLFELSAWKSPELVFGRADFIVFAREGQKNWRDGAIAATQMLQNEFNANIELVFENVPQMVSSSQIREDVHKWSHLLDLEVYEYIVKNRMYEIG